MDTPNPTLTVIDEDGPVVEPEIITDEFIAESTAPMPTVRVEPKVQEYLCSNESCKAPLNPGKAGRKCPQCRFTRA